MRLTPFQREALQQLAKCEADDAYGLRQSLATLKALERKKLAKATYGLGANFSPRTCIQWRITNAGKEAIGAPEL